jgi:hypothetical protein
MMKRYKINMPRQHAKRMKTHTQTMDIMRKGRGVFIEHVGSDVWLPVSAAQTDPRIPHPKLSNAATAIFTDNFGISSGSSSKNTAPNEQNKTADTRRYMPRGGVQDMGFGHGYTKGITVQTIPRSKKLAVRATCGALAVAHLLDKG